VLKVSERADEIKRAVQKVLDCGYDYDEMKIRAIRVDADGKVETTS